MTDPIREHTVAVEDLDRVLALAENAGRAYERTMGGIGFLEKFDRDTIPTSLALQILTEIETEFNK